MIEIKIIVLCLVVMTGKCHADDIEGWWGQTLKEKFSSVSNPRVVREDVNLFEKIKSDLNRDISILQLSLSNVIDKSLAIIYNSFGDELKELNETMQKNNDALLQMIADLQRNQDIILDRLNITPPTYIDCEDRYENGSNTQSGAYLINPVIIMNIMEVLNAQTVYGSSSYCANTQADIDPYWWQRYGVGVLLWRLNYTAYHTDGQGEFRVVCDMDTDGGGWTVIQSREVYPIPSNPTLGTDFYRNWDDYESGFGTIDQFNNFWLGLMKIRRLTAEGNYMLRIDAQKQTGEDGAALYTYFSIGDAADFYRLNVDEYVTGYGPNQTVLELGDSFSIHNNSKFSTPDQDNDETTFVNCAGQIGFGGWWYIPGACYQADLNGVTGWALFVPSYGSLHTTKMMIKRR